MIRISLLLLLMSLVACNNAGSQNAAAPSPEEKAKLAKANQSEVTHYPNGQKKMEGQYDAKGERTGDWFFWYEDGLKMLEAGYREGKQHGKSISYFPNGFKRFEGQYKMDEKSGVWYFYNEDGSVSKKVDFDAGPETEPKND